LLDVLLAALRISTPYTLAALGGVLCERSGVINIALEGVLLGGALGYAVMAEMTGSPWWGVLGAALAGLVIMALHGVLCVYARANQIIVGLGINLLMAGSSRFVLKALYNSSSNGPRVVGFESTWWGAVQSVPGIGLAMATPLVLAALLLVPAMEVLLGRTVLGLRLRAVGEHPMAAASQGVSVARVRMLAVCLGGVLAALGGAYLAADQHQFTQGMSAGRGFIALAAVVFGQWRPSRALCGCLLFGTAEAVQIHLQTASGAVPTQFVQMIPYALTLAVLALSTQKARAPAALGKAFPP
jgi:simple sugar transport system permease protein